MSVIELQNRIDPIKARLERAQSTVLSDVSPPIEQDKQIIIAKLEELSKKKERARKWCEDTEQEIKRLTSHAEALMVQLRVEKAAANSTVLQNYCPLPLISIFHHLEHVLDRQKKLEYHLPQKQSLYTRLCKRMVFAQSLSTKIYHTLIGRDLINHFDIALDAVKDKSPNDTIPEWIDIDNPIVSCGLNLDSPEQELNGLQFDQDTRELLAEFWDCADSLPEERARVWQALINELERRSGKHRRTLAETVLRARGPPKDKPVEGLEEAADKTHSAVRRDQEASRNDVGWSPREVETGGAKVLITKSRRRRRSYIGKAPTPSRPTVPSSSLQPGNSAFQAMIEQLDTFDLEDPALSSPNFLSALHDPAVAADPFLKNLYSPTPACFARVHLRRAKRRREMRREVQEFIGVD